MVFYSLAGGSITPQKGSDMDIPDAPPGMDDVRSEVIRLQEIIDQLPEHNGLDPHQRRREYSLTKGDVILIYKIAKVASVPHLCPFEGDEASVWLTFEDWQVLYDLLFRTPDAKDHLPAEIITYAMQDGEAVIVLHTEDCRIRVEMTG